MNFKIIRLLVIISLTLFEACTPVSRSPMEKKIVGKWNQTGGSGTMANMNLLFDYTFTDKKEFVQETHTTSDQVVLYKQGFNQKGTFLIKNDSIYLYHGDNSGPAFYSAKIQFVNDSKFILFDANGELDYERKN